MAPVAFSSCRMVAAPTRSCVAKAHKGTRAWELCHVLCACGVYCQTAALALEPNQGILLHTARVSGAGFTKSLLEVLARSYGIVKRVKQSAQHMGCGLHVATSLLRMYASSGADSETY